MWLHPLSPGERVRVRVNSWLFVSLTHLAKAALTPALSQRERV